MQRGRVAAAACMHCAGGLARCRPAYLLLSLGTACGKSECNPTAHTANSVSGCNQLCLVRVHMLCPVRGGVHAAREHVAFAQTQSPVAAAVPESKPQEHSRHPFHAAEQSFLPVSASTCYWIRQTPLFGVSHGQLILAGILGTRPVSHGQLPRYWPCP